MPRLLLPALAALSLTAFSAAAQAEILAADAVRIALENGVAVVEELDRDDNKWEVEGKDADGREIEIDIHRQTGEVLKVERD